MITWVLVFHSTNLNGPVPTGWVGVLAAVLVRPVAAVRDERPGQVAALPDPVRGIYGKTRNDTRWKSAIRSGGQP